MVWGGGLQAFRDFRASWSGYTLWALKFGGLDFDEDEDPTNQS